MINGFQHETMLFNDQKKEDKPEWWFQINNYAFGEHVILECCIPVFVGPSSIPMIAQ